MTNEQRELVDTTTLAISNFSGDERGDFVKEAIDLYISHLQAFRPDMAASEVSANALNLCLQIRARFDELETTGGAATVGNA